MSARTAERWLTWVVAIGGPLIVTAVLVRFSHQTQRDYVFIMTGRFLGTQLIDGRRHLVLEIVATDQGSYRTVIPVEELRPADEDRPAGGRRLAPRRCLLADLRSR